MDTLRLSIVLDGAKYVATVEITDGTMPRSIFICENTGTTSLGDYLGVCNLSQLTTYPSWTGVATSTFATPFVRSTSAVQSFNSKDTIGVWYNRIKADVTALKAEISTAQPEITEEPF